MIVRKRLAYLILSLACLSILLGVRFFPFSDYYMFSRSKSDLRAFRLVALMPDGSAEPLRFQQLYPFNRLHMNHMLYSVSLSSKDYSWIEFFLTRVKMDRPETAALAVQEVVFGYDPETAALKVIDSKDIYQAPRHD